MYAFHHVDGVLRRHSRQDAMTEIEDKARPTGILIENPLHLALDMIFGRIEDSRVEVALHGNIGTYNIPGLAEVDMPVETKHIGAGFLDQLKHGAAVLDKVDDRDAVAIPLISSLT